MLDIVLWIIGGLAIFYVVSKQNQIVAAMAEFNKLHEGEEDRRFDIAIHQWQDSLLCSEEEERLRRCDKKYTIKVNWERVA